MFLLMFLVDKIGTLSCPATDAFLVPHEWYQPGDFIIGGMMSHIVYHFLQSKFNENPDITSSDIPIFLPFLNVMTLVSLDIGRRGLREINSAAMTVFHAQKGRFQIKMTWMTVLNVQNIDIQIKERKGVS
ncbi:hypothetical protein E2320_003536 [Naja naja]|nr:hypothetical protein E2320_003536 [Naja naja]